MNMRGCQDSIQQVWGHAQQRLQRRPAPLTLARAAGLAQGTEVERLADRQLREVDVILQPGKGPPGWHF